MTTTVQELRESAGHEHDLRTDAEYRARFISASVKYSLNPCQEYYPFSQVHVTEAMQNLHDRAYWILSNRLLDVQIDGDIDTKLALADKFIAVVIGYWRDMATKVITAYIDKQYPFEGEE